MTTEVLNTISERRLRPIYELLDNGNYKKAFHEAEKVLKKQKDLLAAKVLKTIALHRLGRVEEASALASEVVQQEPIDENSLQGLSLYYKECHKTELISPMYEKAIKKCPQNEEYLSHLFMSYVRHDKFQDMQRVAMHLYKQHPKNPYLFWGIMAIVLQAQNVEDRKLAQAMYLPLAEKMIEKHIEKGKIEAEAEVRLYLLVLELLGKHELILKVLNEDLGKKVTSEVVGYTPLSVTTEEKLGKWHSVNAKYKNLLSKSPDVWNYVNGYLDSFFELLSQGWKPSENGDAEEESNYSDGPHYKIEHAYKFVGNLVKQQDDLYEGKCRGPYLMRLELIKRLKARQKTQQDAPVSQASVKQLLLEYALDFSTKPCCTLDLKPYFQLLPKEEIDEFLEELYKQQATFTFDDVTKDFPAKLKPEINKRKQKEFHRHIFTVEATRFLGGHESMSDEKKVKLIELLIKRYQDGICFCDDQCTTDPRIVDNYCLNAIRLLIDLYEKSGDTSLLWRSVMIMEQTLKESQSNYEIKILLMRIYCRLGIFSPCADLYDSLEIKHIQQNTLGYLVCQHVTSLGHYHPASQVFQIARSFFLANTKESYECLISCFRNGTFHKVLEFVEYRRHISNSVQSALTRTEHVLMDLFTQGNIDQPISNLLEMVDKERINFNQLVDDRDFTVISDVNIAEKQISLEEKKESFSEQKKWLQFRELLVQCAYAALSPSKAVQVNGHIDNSPHTQHLGFETLVAELEQFCCAPHQEPCKYHFCGPHPSPLYLANSAKYPQNMLLIFRVISSVLSTQGKEAPAFTGISQYITTILDNLKEFVDSFRDGLATKNENSFLKEEFLNCEISILAEKIPPCLLKLEPNNLEKMVMCTEMFSFVVLLLCNLQYVISDAKSDVQRRRRKKKGKPSPDTQEPTWIKECQSATESFKTLGEDLASIVCKFKAKAESLVADAEKSYERADDIDSDDEDLPDENVRQLVMKIVRSASDSITISCKQTHDVIEGRLKNLKEMRF